MKSPKRVLGDEESASRGFIRMRKLRERYSPPILADGGVKSYAQNQFWYLVEIYYRGRLNRPLVTVQRAGRKGSRAAVRRSSCP